ncbi:MAG: damage-control phosphatase ARMT1 family protein [Promethearchaeota archaeon]
MDLQPACLACLIGQVAKAYRLLRPEASDQEIVNTQKRVIAKLAQIPQKAMPYYSQAVYQILNQELGENDPYVTMKRQSNQTALALVPHVQQMIQESSTPLLTALTLAILGNTVDFGTPHTIDLEHDLAHFSIDRLAINDFPILQADLDRAQKILILGDNAGECVFDKVLIEFLQHRYPEKEFIYAVRGGPVINDVTLADVQEIGLPQVCKVIEGAQVPGILFDQLSPAFLHEFQTADVILSKGQGNFESLDRVPITHGPIYFLLKAKCDHVAGILGVNVGDLILARESTIFD